MLEFTPKKEFQMLENIKNLEHVSRILFNHKRKIVKKPMNILFKNYQKVSDQLKIDTNLRPGNIDMNTVYKICKEYEKLLK